MNMSEIIVMKENIEKAQLEKANLEGQIDSILNEIQAHFGINEFQIDGHIKDLSDKIEQLKEERDIKAKELEDELSRNEKQNQ